MGHGGGKMLDGLEGGQVAGYADGGSNGGGGDGVGGGGGSDGGGGGGRGFLKVSAGVNDLGPAPYECGGGGFANASVASRDDDGGVGYFVELGWGAGGYDVGRGGPFVQRGHACRVPDGRLNV